MAKAKKATGTTESKETTVNETGAPKKSRVTKAPSKKTPKKTSAPLANRKPATRAKKAPSKRVAAKKKTSSEKSSESTGIIKTVKNKIATAGHALADKIRSDKKD